MNGLITSALLTWASAMATEHRVVIGPGLVYTPASLTIRTGDTVRFTASDAHPLSSDDGSFSCLSECVIRFDRPGTHGFHCDTHGGPNARMAGAVHVTATGSTLRATPAFDGLWYDPAVSGQGIALQAIPETGQVAIGWFTWSDAGDGRHDWLTGIGPINAATTELELARASGGRFNSGPVPASAIVGQATLRFFDCETASLQFTRDDIHRSGTLSLKRLVPARADCIEP